MRSTLWTLTWLQAFVATAVIAQTTSQAGGRTRVSGDVLSTTTLNRTSWQRQPYVSNGYIGQRIPAEGHGYMEVVPNDYEGRDGTNGWPLFDPRFTAAMVANFYDQQAETKGTNFEQTGGQQPISTLPTWSSLYLTLGGSSYGVETPDNEISNWTQSMSIRDGIVSTALTWMPSGSMTGSNSTSNMTSPMTNMTMGTNSTGNTTMSGMGVRLNYTLLAHRTRPNLGVVRLDISGLTAGQEVSITDVFDGRGAWRTNFTSSGALAFNKTMYTAVQPNGINNVTAYEVSVINFDPAPMDFTASASCYSNLSQNESTIAQCYTFNATSSSVTILKYVGIASSDAFNGTEYATALDAAIQANSTGWDELVSEHREAWNELWESGDIEIPGEEFEELQLATRASLFHILSNTRDGNEAPGLGDTGIAPAGLTSDSYAGHIFWDQETWMFPSLLALHPDYALNGLNFRYKQYGRAIENAKQYNSSGLLYPWTAARFGNCTGVGPCYDYEYHLNNDIAIAMYQYYAATQNRTWLEERGYPIIYDVNEFWANHVVYNETTGLYVTLNETDPDEFANQINNGAFTNAAIQVTIQHAQELSRILNQTIPSNWSTIAENITILTDPESDIILEFDGPNGVFNSSTVVKQADVVLLTYPLEYQQSQEQALIDLDFYAGVQSADGPGMTYSIFSIDAAQLSPVGCASYTYMLAASQPYNRAPFYQFSEQQIDEYSENGGTNPSYTFLTGHGGFLQVLTHGYTGYRSRTDRLYFDPNLPPQLTNYTVKGLKWGGSSFDVNVASNQTTITRRSGGSGGSSGNSTSSSDSIQVEIKNQGNYTLGAGETLTVDTRSTNGTLVEGNFAQCAQTVGRSDTSFNNNKRPTVVPGQYGLAAIDGSNATTWRPLSENTTSTLSVDLLGTKQLSSFHINWGKVPAQTFAIYAGRSTRNMTLVAQQNVTISTPYDAATALDVVLRTGNTTDIELDNTVTARYVNLTIRGTYGEPGSGATVAEFAARG
ncbi:alpha,alpha-trehalase ath1 [Microbotryomycetes sp. JL221]|nr:alpha,alpha-trehalase ath1 [Microbotryomycetes sp. JL221]